ncbi:MAG TPA: long-chain fatty acid--CoA ligase [Verrucomicrobiales bacterium]|nr:long-chain fatty acid--CoA ligase [Verrucomicrobiales bacterium]HIL69278.1 long-chain fatty acid--CoA ligase [Verrucomicrobiota bacterium]
MSPAMHSFSNLFSVFEELDRGDTSIILESDGKSKCTDDSPDSQCLGVLTSGTTGQPKTIWHEWGSLKLDTQTSSRRHGWKWASCFLPGTYAGVQVALQAWMNQGQVYSLRNDWHFNWDLVKAESVNAISCTPTFLDLWIQNEPVRSESECSDARWQPEQITLGGESLRENAGARFRHRFPKSRFSVIYASTELGVIYKTSRTDGWYESGDLHPRYAEWRIDDCSGSGCLELQLAESRQWLSTGDLAEASEGLVRISGRREDVANVGGIKVNLALVEQAAEQVDGILRVKAFSKPNPVTGEIVGLVYEPSSWKGIGSELAGSNQEDLENIMMGQLRLKLPKVAWPRVLLVGKIEVGENGKKTARELERNELH